MRSWILQIPIEAICNNPGPDPISFRESNLVTRSAFFKVRSDTHDWGDRQEIVLADSRGKRKWITLSVITVMWHSWKGILSITCPVFLLKSPTRKNNEYYLRPDNGQELSDSIHISMCVSKMFLDIQQRVVAECVKVMTSLKLIHIPIDYRSRCLASSLCINLYKDTM
jgi:hypothetical protein